MEAKPKRWLFRFSLRTLLVLVTIACVGFGWLGVKVRQANRQREAVEAIRKLGGNVVYDYQFVSEWEEFINAPPPGPEFIRQVVGIDFLSDVVVVQLQRGQCTDADLVYLERLPQLKFVSLIGEQFTDAGLVHLKGLSRFTTLYNSDTEITDKGCQELKKSHPNLKIWRDNFRASQ